MKKKRRKNRNRNRSNLGISCMCMCTTWYKTCVWKKRRRSIERKLRNWSPVTFCWKDWMVYKMRCRGLVEARKRDLLWNARAANKFMHLSHSTLVLSKWHFLFLLMTRLPASFLFSSSSTSDDIDYEWAEATRFYKGNYELAVSMQFIENYYTIKHQQQQQNIQNACGIFNQFNVQCDFSHRCFGRTPRNIHSLKFSTCFKYATMFSFYFLWTKVSEREWETYFPFL